MYKNRNFHIGLVIVGFILDQITKLWAVAAFALEDGTPTNEVYRLVGDLFRFRLAYNTGAAFSMQPQKILPFLSPTIFYLLLSTIAIVLMIIFYRKLPKWDWASKLGISLILSGAFGNMFDRIRIQKVIDFIDWDFPDMIIHRWPTFNLADSWVCIGVVFVILGPMFLDPKKKNSPSNSSSEVEQ
ncbi:MAG: signal peptidase II [Fibrobacterales bacterium]